MGWRRIGDKPLSEPMMASSGFPRVTSNEISWPFPDYFLAKSQFLMTFCSMKYDILTLAGIHTGHTDAKKLLQRPFGKENKYDLAFCVLYQLNHGMIYKMSNIMEILFPILLHFLLATVRLSNHIMTLTVTIRNEAFILISTPFFVTFSWLFGEFQNLLTHIKMYWLFLTFDDFNLFLTFPDPWEPCSLPRNICSTRGRWVK